MIASGNKISLDDMLSIQQDVVDVVAKRVAINIVTILDSSAKELFQPSEVAVIDSMTAILRGWDGSFDLESVAASVFTRW